MKMHLIRFLLHYINTVYLKFYEVFFPYYKWLPDEAFCTDFYVCFQEKASSCFQGPHQLEVPCIIQPCTEQNHLSYTFLWNQTYLWLLKLYIIVGKTIYSDKQANRCGIFEKKNMFKVEICWKQLQIVEKVWLNDKDNKYGKQSTLLSTLLPLTYFVDFSSRKKGSRCVKCWVWVGSIFLCTSPTREKKFIIQKQTDGRSPELPW